MIFCSVKLEYIRDILTKEGWKYFNRDTVIMRIAAHALQNSIRNAFVSERLIVTLPEKVAVVARLTYLAGLATGVQRLHPSNARVGFVNEDLSDILKSDPLPVAILRRLDDNC